jgi:maleate cis-trans isomerase
LYGQRGRIGLIVPSSNTVCEPEMAALCPPGVATYATRILFEPTLEGLKAMKDHVGRAAAELSSEGMSHVIAFCCTVGSMIGGSDHDVDIIRLIEEKTGVPAVTTTTALKAALNALGVSRIAVATPYTLEIDELEKSLLENMGYEVTELKGYHEHVDPKAFKNDMIGRLGPEIAYELVLSVDGPRNEALFISCTNFRAVDVIQRLEDKTGKPVLSSNQVTMWHSLCKLGIHDGLKGYGRLFDLGGIHENRH